MKRITLLAVLAVVMTVVAIPAMAGTTFAWSGEITSTFQTDFTTAAEGVATANISLGVTINDNLSFTGLIITTANAPGGSTSGALTNGNGAFDATVQLGKVLGLDSKTIGEAITIGNFAPGGTAYGASGYANEEVWGAGMTQSGGIAIASVTTINSMINLYLAVDPATLIGGTPAYLADVYGAFGPVSVSVGYGSNGQESLDVLFAPAAMGDLTFAVAVGQNYDTAGTGTLKLGFGGKFAYKTLVTFGLGTSFDVTNSALGTIDINVNLAPAATWGADVWTVLDTANSLFGGSGYLDLSVWTKLDASTLRLGYVYTSSTSNLGYYVARTPGGLYFSYDVTF